LTTPTSPSTASSSASPCWNFAWRRHRRGVRFHRPSRAGCWLKAHVLTRRKSN
jgi:hypothetical protein